MSIAIELPNFPGYLAIATVLSLNIVFSNTVSLPIKDLALPAFGTAESPNVNPAFFAGKQEEML